MKTSSKIMIAAGAGLILGGILGILFAPNKGTVTRKKIAEAPGKLVDTVKSKIRVGKERLEEAIDTI